MWGEKDATIVCKTRRDHMCDTHLAAVVVVVVGFFAHHKSIKCAVERRVQLLKTFHNGSP